MNQFPVLSKYLKSLNQQSRKQGEKHPGRESVKICLAKGKRVHLYGPDGHWHGSILASKDCWYDPMEVSLFIELWDKMPRNEHRAAMIRAVEKGAKMYCYKCPTVVIHKGMYAEHPTQWLVFYENDV